MEQKHNNEIVRALKQCVHEYKELADRWQEKLENLPTEAIQKKKECFLAADHIPIGSGYITIRVVDEEGKPIKLGCVMVIDTNGEVERSASLNQHVGLRVDCMGRIVTKN